jgi:hypothetical protein
VYDRASVLRITEQLDQVGHPVQGKINGVFGPAGEDLLLDLAHPNLDIHRSSLLGGPSRPARTATASSAIEGVIVEDTGRAERIINRRTSALPSG